MPQSHRWKPTKFLGTGWKTRETAFNHPDSDVTNTVKPTILEAPCTKKFSFELIVPTHFNGGGTIYSTGFSLLSQLSPVDMFFVQNCAWYH